VAYIKPAEIPNGTALAKTEVSSSARHIAAEQVPATRARKTHFAKLGVNFMSVSNPKRLNR
tara:strand:+ start:3172 stop:3354 length:183 start_codon:yes stop_codon:yes gene_type:complete